MTYPVIDLVDPGPAVEISPQLRLFLPCQTHLLVFAHVAIPLQSEAPFKVELGGCLGHR